MHEAALLLFSFTCVMLTLWSVSRHLSSGPTVCLILYLVLYCCKCITGGTFSIVFFTDPPCPGRTRKSIYWFPSSQIWGGKTNRNSENGNLYRMVVCLSRGTRPACRRAGTFGLNHQKDFAVRKTIALCQIDCRTYNEY